MGLNEYKFGFDSENDAVKFLQNLGYEILERNFHSKFGEIDIIAKKGEILHFVEVKATAKDYETIYRVSKSKIAKIIKTINYYLLKTSQNLGYQIDLICVENGKIKLLENITI